VCVHKTSFHTRYLPLPTADTTRPDPACPGKLPAAQLYRIVHHRAHRMCTRKPSVYIAGRLIRATSRTAGSRNLKRARGAA
jgi:hypothetical protein